jgi:DNA-binding response OmpR family regulator
VVILTTSNSSNEQNFYARYGADFFTKPHRFDELKKKIHQVVIPRWWKNKEAPYFVIST